MSRFLAILAVTLFIIGPTAVIAGEAFDQHWLTIVGAFCTVCAPLAVLFSGVFEKQGGE